MCCSISSDSSDGFTVEDLNEEFYVFNSEKWPGNWSQVPSVGNGHLATVIKYPWFYMSGLFNGEERKSQRARIPSTLSVSLKSDQEPLSTTNYKLDTRKGIFCEQHEINGWNISLQWFAHRTVLPIFVFQVVAIRNKQKDKIISKSDDQNSCIKSCLKESLVIDLDVLRNFSSDDIDFKKLDTDFTNVGFYQGETKIPEHPEHSKCQQFYILHDIIPDKLEIKKNHNLQKWTFITSMHYSKNVVLQAYKHGHKLAKSNKLEGLHYKKWLKLWASGRIELQGNVKYSQAAAASIYNILSSIPIQKTNPFSSETTNLTKDYTTLFTGLSPSGLPWGDEESYQGHTFWDAETWMFPSVMMLHYKLSSVLLHSRVRTMDVAAQNAKMAALKGLRYPWESGLTGIETAPDKECGEREIHINGDISLAIQQYLKASPLNNSKNITFPTSYLEILEGIGDFWLSRSEFDDMKQLYEIKDVMPPDEYARLVNNSAFTNAVAALSLSGACMASQLLGHTNSSIYEEAAAKMYIPYDSRQDYHPEFDGFKLGTKIKQADVVLMGFPLMMNMSDATRKSDLEKYEINTDLNGPAMSDSMHAVGWLEVGQEKRAHDAFMRMFQHIDGDFQVWTEEKGGKGASNFITGMGGYLQALLFGYGGLRIFDDKLQINPSIMDDVSKITWHGIDYRGCSFDLEVFENKSMILTLRHLNGNMKVSFEILTEGRRIHLKKGQPYKTKMALGYIRVDMS